jgi:uncharacterized protein with HEPN domain
MTGSASPYARRGLVGCEICRRAIEGRRQFALTRAIEIVRRSSLEISPETRTALPNIPWTKVVSIRNRLVHACFSIDHDILWNTATVSIPELLHLLDDADLD